jgi:hypothetical protein
MFVVVWVFYGAIYRWRRTRLSDADVEGPLERAGTTIRSWFGGRKRQSS